MIVIKKNLIEWSPMQSKKINMAKITLQRWLFDNWLSNKIKRSYQMVRKLIEWAPIIWEDHDFDGDYFLRIVKYKLQRMEKSFRSATCVVDNDKLADEINNAIQIIKKILDNRYESEEIYRVEKSYNVSWTFKCIKKGEYYEAIRTPSRPLDKKEMEQYNKDISMAFKIAYEKKQNDLAEAFGLIAERLDYWWW